MKMLPNETSLDLEVTKNKNMTKKSSVSYLYAES